ARLLDRLLRDLDGDVHHCMWIDADTAVTETHRQIVRQFGLLGCRQHQRTPCAELFDFARQVIEGAGTEHDAPRRSFVDERLHMSPLSLWPPPASVASVAGAARLSYCSGGYEDYSWKTR